MLGVCTADQLILRGFNAANGVLVDAIELDKVLWDKIQNLQERKLLMVMASAGALHRIRTTPAGIIFSQS
jgi:hypothetical protein